MARPLAASSRTWRPIASASGASNPDVGSSSRSTSGLRVNARAIATRACSPPESLDASRAAKSSSRPAASSAAARSGGSSSPYARLSATVPGSITGRWATNPTRRRSTRGSSVATSTPSSVTTPPSSATSRTIARRSVDLPAPLGAVSATTSPGATVSATSRRTSPTRTPSQLSPSVTA